MRSIVTPLLLLLSASLTAPLAAATARVVEIHVVDQQAKALLGVAVTLSVAPEGGYRETATTDGSGVVTFSVPDGKKSYRIEAAAPELAPFAEVVDLGARKLPRGESVRLEITLAPPTAADYFNSAVAALKLSDFSRAEIDLRQALAIDPNLVPGWAVLSLVLLEKSESSWLVQAKQNGQLESEADITVVSKQLTTEALGAAERALTLVPDDVKALHARYEALQKLGRTREADDALTTLAAHDNSPALARLLFNAGAVAGNAGELDLARRRLGQAVERDPALWQAHTALAELDVREQHLDRAVVELDKALALAPQQKRVWQRKVELLKALGRDDDAAAAEQRLAELGGAG